MAVAYALLAFLTAVVVMLACSYEPFGFRERRPKQDGPLANRQSRPKAHNPAPAEESSPLDATEATGTDALEGEEAPPDLCETERPLSKS